MYYVRGWGGGVLSRPIVWWWCIDGGVRWCMMVVVYGDGVW